MTENENNLKMKDYLKNEDDQKNQTHNTLLDFAEIENLVLAFPIIVYCA